MVAAFSGCWSKVPFLWFGTLFHGETQSAVQAVLACTIEVLGSIHMPYPPDPD